MALTNVKQRFISCLKPSNLLHPIFFTIAKLPGVWT